MSITDELREWAHARFVGLLSSEWEHELLAIADRIDEQHRKALEKVAAMVDEPDEPDEPDAFIALMDGFNIGRARGYDEGFKAHLDDLEARIGAVERKLNHRGER